jgi:hypothetical protein
MKDLQIGIFETRLERAYLEVEGVLEEGAGGTV